MSSYSISDYKTKAFAWVDILGFKNLVDSLHSPHGSKEASFDQIAKVMEKIQNRIENHNSVRPDEISNDFQITAFSDSIVVSADPTNAHGLVSTTRWISQQLMSNGVLTRGAIVLDEILHKGAVVFGRALIRAYELESKSVIWPRYIIDPNLKRLVESQHGAHPDAEVRIVEDIDGLPTFNPFEITVDGGGYADRPTRMAEWGQVLNQKIRELNGIQNWDKRQAIQSKIAYLCRKFNVEVDSTEAPNGMKHPIEIGPLPHLRLDLPRFPTSN
jgi:hypothetical protein